MKIYANTQPTILCKQFEFTHNPYDLEVKLAFQNEQIFDTSTLTHLGIFNVPIIGGQRLNKIQQYLVLNQHGIRTPTTYFNNREYRPFNNIQEFDSFCELDKFVVKPILGARGIGIKIVDRKQYKKLMENPSKNVSAIYSKELEQQKEYAFDVDNEYVQYQFSGSQMIVQNLIKVKNEFRLICFPNDSLIYERKKEEGQFLGNLSHGSTPVMVDEDFINKIDSTVIKNIRKIMQKFSYPWLSVDLYVDEEDNLGIFEFQMEFAYEGFNPTEIRKKMEDSIYSFIK